VLQASNFVEAVQNNQRAYIACLEEITYRKKWITSEQVIKLALMIKK
jgi:glucose-1-phosphate thymidylyltransferase